MAFHKEPHWVPAKPKRFAWTIGIVLIVTCFICWRIGWENGFKQKYEARYQVIDVDEAMDCSVLDLTDLSDYPLAARMQVIMKTIAIICAIVTWLEASCGFCVGCFVYGKFNKVAPPEILPSN